MNKIENLAKILFLFFAVISLGLVTVSCSDDEEKDSKKGIVGKITYFSSCYNKSTSEFGYVVQDNSLSINNSGSFNCSIESINIEVSITADTLHVEEIPINPSTYEANCICGRTYSYIIKNIPQGNYTVEIYRQGLLIETFNINI